MEAICIRQILGELGFPIEELAIIYSMNQTEIEFTNNPSVHRKMKKI